MSAAPWLDRATELLGTYEEPGAKDNPVILAMAQRCGGKIAKTYHHDSIPWCAMFVNYCLISSGQEGNDSLWALDFRNYGIKLNRPVLGAIATMKRTGGGHTGIVAGRTKNGFIVLRGGNQSDMVKDAPFDPRGMQFNWPRGVPIPKEPLPVVTSLLRSKRPITLAMIGEEENKQETMTAVALADIPEYDPHEKSSTGLVVARTIGLGSAGIGALANTVVSVTGPVTKTIEQVKEVTDQTGQIIDVTKQVHQVLPDTFFEKLLAMFRSPEFLAFALFAVILAWIASWWLSKYRKAK